MFYCFRILKKAQFTPPLGPSILTHVRAGGEGAGPSARGRGERKERGKRKRKEKEKWKKERKKRRKRKEKEGREREREYAPAIITAAAAAQSATRVVTSDRTAHTERGKKETGQWSDSGVRSGKGFGEKRAQGFRRV